MQLHKQEKTHLVEVALLEFRRALNEPVHGDEFDVEKDEREL
jgi:hypothetical protein